MKIEMLEYAISSYLKNVEGCDFVQSNWTLSKRSYSMFKSIHEKFVYDLVGDIKKEVPVLDILKKSKPSKFVKQSEIDVVGIKKFSEIFFYEAAFHEAGLNYGDNAQNVLKKIIRSFIIATVFYPQKKVNIAFVSPVVNPKDNKLISDYIRRVNPILYGYNSNVSIHLFFNEQCADLFKNLIDEIADIKDDNDLFVRSVKLFLITSRLINTKTKVVNSKNKITFKNRDLIYSKFDSLILDKKLTAAIVSDLENINYCRLIFKFKYPLLVKLSNLKIQDQNRYYSRIFLINGESYKISNDWYDEQIKKFCSWFDDLYK